MANKPPGPSSPQPLTTLKLPGRHKRRQAQMLLDPRPSLSWPSTGRPTSIQVVCVSDTHNSCPDVPFGDLLIHSGDLTGTGSFDKIQSGLLWLSSSPHKHKILVAGNHDVLLDELFLAQYPERRYGQTKTKEDLDWGSVVYLQCIPEFPHRYRGPSIRYQQSGFRTSIFM